MKLFKRKSKHSPPQLALFFCMPGKYGTTFLGMHSVFEFLKFEKETHLYASEILRVDIIMPDANGQIDPRKRWVYEGYT